MARGTATAWLRVTTGMSLTGYLFIRICGRMKNAWPCHFASTTIPGQRLAIKAPGDGSRASSDKVRQYSLAGSLPLKAGAGLLFTNLQVPVSERQISYYHSHFSTILSHEKVAKIVLFGEVIVGVRPLIYLL